MLLKLNLPPFKTASLITIGVVWSVLLLAARAFNGSGGGPFKTVEAASIMTVAAFGLATVFFGALLSASIRDVIFKPSKEPEAELSLLFCGGVTTLMGIYSLNRVFELLHQAQPR